MKTGKTGAREPQAAARLDGQTARRAIWIGLALAVALDTVTPLVWKAAVMRLPAMTSGAALAEGALAQPLFAIVLMLFVAQFFNWMAVLARADVSYAQPITALSYISVAWLAVALFGESFSVLRGAGVAVILLGVWLIGSTPARTTGGPLNPSAAEGRVP